MLATMNISQSTASIHQNNQLDLQARGEHVDLDKVCPGCKLTAVTDDGGLVVAFGQSFFHVDCFQCAKCGNKVTADTNLLLLSDGSPVCANCSYNCNVCKQPILDEAIMTGDDSYHAHCFKCKVCRNRIDELVFAKTSQGIYCMDCHSERMIKIRKHAQRKAEREKAAAANGGSNSSRDSRKRDNGHPSPVSSPYDTPASSKTYRTTASFSTEPSTPKTKEPPSAGRRRSGPYVDDAFSPKSKPSPSYLTPLFPLPPQQHPSVTVAPPADIDPPSRPSLAPHSLSSDYLPPNARLNASNTPPLSTPKRRRSTNPGLVLNNLHAPAGSSSGPSPTLSPLSASFTPQQNTSSAIPAPQDISDSPRASPPLLDQVRGTANSRPVSNGSAASYGSQHRDLSSTQSNGYSSPRQHNPRHTEDQPVSAPPARSDDTRSRNISSPNINVTQFPEGTRRHDLPMPDGIRPRRSFDERPAIRERVSSTSSVRTPSSGTSRAPSRAAVPRTIAEGGRDHASRQPQNGVPPPPPPKLERQTSSLRSTSEARSTPSEMDGDMSYVSQMDSGSEENSESSPVEQTSHSTFIAPALPPIRFSMNTADFSELLSSVGGIDALKVQWAENQETEDGVPPTPPPSAASNGFTSSPSVAGSDDTVFPSHETTSSSNSISQADAAQEPPGSSIFDTHITLTPPESAVPGTLQPSDPDFVFLRLQEAMTDARDRGAQQLKLDRGFVEAIVQCMHARKTDVVELQSKVDGMKRASKQYIEGLTVAQTEYDSELKARRDAEAEVTRLRVLLSGQAARLTTLSGDSRKQELRQQMTKDLHDKLSGLENDLSKLNVDRDIALTEIEEISAAKSLSADQRAGALNRSLLTRLDNLKSQYRRDLVPLSRERESLAREIAELKAVRDVFLEETTVLNARNEELAQLSAQYARRMDSLPETPKKTEITSRPSEDPIRAQQTLVQPLSQNISPSTTSLVTDESSNELRPTPKRSDIDLPTPSKGKFIKWPGSRGKDVSNNAAEGRTKSPMEHNFQQLSVLRFTRCDHCGDKMWGSQLRCLGCNISVHVRCINNVQIACSHQSAVQDDNQPLPPSMFGRDLVDQVRADAARGGPREVPVIVEKCIATVEAMALDYEGVYRKTGGSGQTKAITQLFERGDYDAFDLQDSDRFNDICSVTSVLKTYFRTLPVPLFTYDLHDHFMAAVEIRDVPTKDQTLIDLVNRLPREHYATVRELMTHLHRIMQRSERNLMNARNLGVVFGPTLMRSRNPGAEFSDMAGKALMIEWLVENAPLVFSQRTAPSLH